jgi:thiamine biosynthesis lipoprotein
MPPPRKSTRRQFLKGRAAIDALADLPESSAARVDGARPTEVSDTRTGPGTFLLQIERRAMACNFAVNLNAGQYPEGPEVAVASLDLVEALEDQMTVYREHSEISQINRSAGNGPVGVESRLHRLLSYAVELGRETEGAFDITSGPLSKVWGFFRRQGCLPDPSQLSQALDRVGFRWLTLAEPERTIAFGRPDIELNLGGIGKGYALDRCAEMLLGAGVEDFLLHGGQSSVLARGSRSRGSPDLPGWTVGIRHPIRPDRRIAEIRLQDLALGTSGTGTQYFHHKGRRYGHILDPRTGWPAEGVLSSTAIAPQASSADALATAFYVMGLEQAERFCQHHPEIGAILVCPGATWGALDVHAINVSDERWRCLEPPG